MLFTAYVLQVRYTGNLFWVFLVTLFLALGAVNLGIFLSTFARSELQAVQFIPLVLAPQGFLRRRALAGDGHAGLAPGRGARAAADLRQPGAHQHHDPGQGADRRLAEFTVLLLFAALMVAIAALTLRREVA